MANSVGNRPIYRQALIEKYIERYAEGHMNDAITIHRGNWQSLTQVYSGRARVHLLAGAIQMGFGDEPQDMVSGTITIPAHSEDDDQRVTPTINDLVTITDNHDPRAIGRTFRVMHVDAAGQFDGFTTMSVIGSEDNPTATGRPV